MFSDAVLEKFLSHPEMQKIPVGCQSTAIHIFEEILEKAQEVNPFVSVSEFLSGADANESAGVSELQSGYAESLY